MSLVISQSIKFVIIVSLLVSITSCEQQVKFEQFADYAIEMDSKSITLAYDVANGRKYVLTLAAGEDATIYPTGQVTFSYTLINKTDKNYRFTVCLLWREYTDQIGCDTVTFIGQSSVTLTHTVALGPGSGQLWVEGTDILVEPIGNDSRPQYFSATLTVDAACPSGEKCCNYLPDGSCGRCVDPQKNQACP
jgi:hypothetical protein